MTRLTAIALAVLFPGTVPAADDPFVVNTNWTITGPGTGIFDPGFGVDPDPGRPGYIPQYNDYDWMCTDDRGVRSGELAAWLDAWAAYCRPEIDGVEVLNRIEDLQVGLDRVQIVVNHVEMDGAEPTQSMFTITFPPRFSIDPQHRYPMVICGVGYGGRGLNETVFDELPLDLVRVKTAYLADEADRGIVHVRWNSGGYHCLGVNDEARHAVNELIQTLHVDFGCDRDRIITIGGSRAGFGALTLAQNRAHQVYDYTVVGVFAKVMPLSMGKISQMPVATLPSMAGTYCSNVGPTANRYDHQPPAGMNSAILVPAFGAGTGGMPLTQVADELCPDHPANLSALAGKYVMLAYSTHDSYFPLNHFLEMDNWLSCNRVAHTTCITLQGGHASCAAPAVDAVFRDFIVQVLNDPGFVPGEYQPPDMRHGLFENARNYFIDIGRTHHGKNVLPLEMPQLPFSMTIPYRLGCDVFGEGQTGVANEPGIVFLSGAEGKPWEVSVRCRKSDGGLGQPRSWSGVFGKDESHIIEWWPGREGWDWFPVESTGAGGPFDPGNDWLEWSVICDGVDYSSYTNWAQNGERLPLETEITASQPELDWLEVSFAREGDPFTGFGVDAVPPLPWVDISCSPATGTVPLRFACLLTAGCYAPTDRILAFSVDLTLADGTSLPGLWQGTMPLESDQSSTHSRAFEFSEGSHIGVNRFDVLVTDVTPPPYNQPPYQPSGLIARAEAVATVAGQLSDPVCRYRWLLATDPGWAASGDWALGRPLGLGGEGGGGPDPDSGHSGTRVFGYQLAGDYTNDLPATHLTSAGFDCSGFSDTHLRFSRWLGVDLPAHDRAAVQARADGGEWVTVWENEGEVVDVDWEPTDLDISAVADGRTDVQIRWTMGPTNGTVTYCGWNIDDIEIWARQPQVATITDHLACMPSAGTLPLTTCFKYTLSNICGSPRRVATRVNLDLAGGERVDGWRRGYQNIDPRSDAIVQWNQVIPALGSTVGDNRLTFESMDVTPGPYNQPPHAPSGCRCGATCVVTGITP